MEGEKRRRRKRGGGEIIIHTSGCAGRTTTRTRVRLTRTCGLPAQRTESEGHDAGEGRGGKRGNALALTERRQAARRASLPGHAAVCEARPPTHWDVLFVLTTRNSQEPATLTAHLPTVGRSHRPLCIDARELVCTPHEEPATPGTRCCNACEILRANIRRMRSG